MAQILRMHKLHYCLFVRTYASQRLQKTHYETLRVSPLSSQKEIRSAFVKLSKEMHPDINKGKDSHSKFVALNEAYRVLSKASSRREYDSMMNSNDIHQRHPRGGWRNYTTDRTENDPEFRFYTVSTDPRTKAEIRAKSLRLAFMCIVFMIVGGVLQGALIVYSVTLRRDKMMAESARLSRELEEQRRAIENKTIDEQAAIILERYSLQQEHFRQMVEERKSL